MKVFNFSIFITAFLLAHTASALIFDNGSRRANVNEAPEPIRWASRAVVSVFSPSGFIQQPNGDYLVKKFQMNAVPNSPKTDALRMVCETELYSRDYRAESLKGSGILITPDHVLVPAHLYKRSTDCKERKLVINYTGYTDIIPHEDVYSCVKREYIRYDVNPEFRPEGQEYGTSKMDGHMDYAIIKLDRPVKGIEPARVNDNSELLKLNDRLYFVSSMRGLPQTVESAEIKFIAPAVISTNASTAQGSSGGIYFNEEGLFIGMHISSNPASNAKDDESNCLRWVQESTETFAWDTLVYIKERGVERPFGALMLPTTAFHKKLFTIQKAYLDELAQKNQEDSIKQQLQQTQSPTAPQTATVNARAPEPQSPKTQEEDMSQPIAPVVPSPAKIETETEGLAEAETNTPSQATVLPVEGTLSQRGSRSKQTSSPKVVKDTDKTTDNTSVAAPTESSMSGTTTKEATATTAALKETPPASKETDTTPTATIKPKASVSSAVTKGSTSEPKTSP